MSRDVHLGVCMASSNSRPSRQNSGGYDFGGYVPGADYGPRRHPRWKAIVAIVLILGMVGLYALFV